MAGFGYYVVGEHDYFFSVQGAGDGVLDEGFGFWAGYGVFQACVPVVVDVAAVCHFLGYLLADFFVVGVDAATGKAEDLCFCAGCGFDGFLGFFEVGQVAVYAGV